jgi:hypothetical protein
MKQSSDKPQSRFVILPTSIWCAGCSSFGVAGENTAIGGHSLGFHLPMPQAWLWVFDIPKEKQLSTTVPAIN